VAGFLLGQRHGALAGGQEGGIAPGLLELFEAVGGAADGEGGLARGAGDREGGDEGALDLGSPAADAGAARDGGEIEQVAEGGERIVAGETFGAAAVADDGQRGVGRFAHDERKVRRTWGCRKGE
jgi:hypothetical protein